MNVATPTMRQEVLAAPDRRREHVNGATITSEAYEASLLAALDKAGFHAANGSTAPTRAPTDDSRGGRGGHDSPIG